MPEEQDKAQESTKSMEDESPVIQADNGVMGSMLLAGIHAAIGGMLLTALL